METETDNEEKRVKPPTKERPILPMKKSSNSNNLVLNITFEIKKDYDYMCKLLYNQGIFVNFRTWMDTKLVKKVKIFQ